MLYHLAIWGCSFVSSGEGPKKILVMLGRVFLKVKRKVQPPPNPNNFHTVPNFFLCMVLQKIGHKFCVYVLRICVCVFCVPLSPPSALHIKQSSPMLTPAAVCISNYSLCSAGSQGKTGGQVTTSHCSLTQAHTPSFKLGLKNRF